MTTYRPKALCPVNNRTLVDRAVDSVRPFAHDVAVNMHYLADQVCDHFAGQSVHLSNESDQLLGSAGALGHLREWIAGRAVLVRNADAFLAADLSELVADWDGSRPRLLGRVREGRSDFGNVQYVGACLLPAASVLDCPDRFASLLQVVWAPAWGRGDLQFVMTSGEFVDCGTPADYLRANLVASGGASVVGPGAVVLGRLDRSVVWPGGFVGPTEHLHDCIRIGRDVTVQAGEHQR